MCFDVSSHIQSLCTVCMKQCIVSVLQRQVQITVPIMDKNASGAGQDQCIVAVQPRRM